MKHLNVVITGIALIVMAAILLTAGSARASYITIGDTGNSADPATGSNYGAVNYKYQISKTEVSGDEWSQMSAAQYMASGQSGNNTPAYNINLYRASAYANWKTTGDPDQGFYDIQWSGTAGDSDATGWNSTPAAHDSTEMDNLVASEGTVYVLPTENEWYKAAFYNLDENKYYTYAIPDSQLVSRDEDGSTIQAPPVEGQSAGVGEGWRYGRDADGNNYFSSTRAVDSGSLEQNGTLQMMGNINEWTEESGGVLRGGQWNIPASYVSSGSNGRSTLPAGSGSSDRGFRLAAIPEPGSAMLLVLASGLLFVSRRRARA